MRALPLLSIALAVAGCQRAKPSDVGAMSIKTAGGDALANATAEAHEVSPKVISPAAQGTPYKLSP